MSVATVRRRASGNRHTGRDALSGPVAGKSAEMGHHAPRTRTTRNVFEEADLSLKRGDTNLGPLSGVSLQY